MSELFNDKVAVIALGVIGFALCAPMARKVALSGNWLGAPGIFGSLLGVLALVLVASVALGRELPGIPGDRAALVILGAIVVVKFGIAAVFKVGA
ncbi:MAG TPA: hypothetical protein VF960_12580 [Chloroflexota bacterium]